MSAALIGTVHGYGQIPYPEGDDCNAADVVLDDYPQWAAENGYFVGEYSFYGGDGNPYTSGSWNYDYSHYRGFISGNTVGNAYRQRNVFLYPPQKQEICDTVSDTVTGTGVCGVNGNSKLFEADQSATTCSVQSPGSIEGPYGETADTYTDLVGMENSVLYQVYLKAGIVGNLEPRIIQSQLTTFTQMLDGTSLRTRTAQGFDAFAVVGTPTSASFYREREVDSEEFWRLFDETVAAYNIQEEDLCAENGGSVSACMSWINQSWEL